MMPIVNSLNNVALVMGWIFMVLLCLIIILSVRVLLKLFCPKCLRRKMIGNGTAYVSIGGRVGYRCRCGHVWGKITKNEWEIHLADSAN